MTSSDRTVPRSTVFHMGHLRNFINAHRALTAICLAGLMATITIVALVGSERSASAEINHPSVAPEAPNRDVPIVLDGDVWKSVQFNDRVIVAGEFSQVETSRGGPVV